MSNKIIEYVQSDSIRQNILMASLNKYYDNKEHLDALLEIINSTSKISLRIIDWFVTNYSKKNNIYYYIPKKKASFKKKISPKSFFVPPSNDTYSKYVQFIVFLRYKSQLKAYSKKKFDPFCRKERITNWGPTKDILTTIGQLNFFKWAIQNKVIDYIKLHLTEIEEDMTKNIRKNYGHKTKKTKKYILSSTKNENENEHENNGTENEIIILDSSDPLITIEKKTKSKRRELSNCATRTLNKHNNRVVIDFD